MIPESKSVDSLVAELTTEPLTNEQERELSNRIKAGDRDAIGLLVEANARYAVREAHRFRSGGQATVDDLISAALLGLATAAAKFDGDRGVRFLSYAKWYVISAMQREAAEIGAPVRIPMYNTQGASAVYRFYNRQGNCNRRVSTDDAVEISAERGKTAFMATAAIIKMQRHKALDADADHDGNPLKESAKERLAYDGPDPLSTLEAKSRKQFCAELVSKLPDRHRRVMEILFIEPDEWEGYHRAAATLGVSKQRVFQIQGEAIEMLRKIALDAARDEVLN